MSNKAPTDPETNLNPLLRWAVTGGAVLLAALHALVHEVNIDSTTVALLVLGARPWLQPLFKSIELLGMKFELRELEKTVLQQRRNIELIEKGAALPGSPMAKASVAGDTATQPIRRDSAGSEWEEDPNKGKFGGSPERNDRRLEAVIAPATDERSAAADIVLRVISTDPKHPLTGKVRFSLHPTFGRWAEYDVEVKRGVAKDEITSWGAFTVGAIADEGTTRLELDLATVKGGPPKFYTS
jgi:hypothetical protein